jgi:hypothetical protein
LTRVAAEISGELQEFLYTRLELLRAEMRENLQSWKIGLPLLACALALLGTAFLLLTVAVVAFISLAFPPTALGWAVSLVIVACLWSVPGFLLAVFARRRLRHGPLVPQKTLDVLKADKKWLKGETKAA